APAAPRSACGCRACCAPRRRPGLCRKTRQAIPAAIRRGLEKRPEVAYALLNAHDLLRDA
ncbi:hypothetical protein ACV33R_31450, partial [Pseudomonas aeruginosa]